MKKLVPTSVRVTLIIAVVVTVLLIVISSLTGLSLPDMFVKGILTPLRTGASKLTEDAQQLYSYIFEYESLETENELLKEQLSQLTEDARDAEAAARDNERLRQRLGLSQGNDPEKVERQLRAVLPPEESSDFCHRIVLFGRETCTARGYNCGTCPLSDLCAHGMKKGEN